MKILSKNFYILSNNSDITIKDIRKQILNWLLVLINILVFPTIIIGVIEAVELDQILVAISYLCFYIPILSALILQKRMPYWLAVYLFLFGAFSIGVINIIFYGFSGAGLPIFYTIAVLSTIFFGIRSGFITLLICSIPMTIVAYLMINNILSLDIDLMAISKYPISWITAIVVMLFLGSIMVFGYGIIQINLLHSLKLLRNQANELKTVNKKQKEEIIERIKIQEQLEKAKQKAEESDLLKTEFLNNMSHEIRTPLNGLLGFSSVITKPDLTDEKKEQYTNIINNSGNQLMKIIDDILEISQLGTKQSIVNDDQVCLNTLFNNIFSNYEEQAKEINVPLYLKKGLSNKNSKVFTDELKLTKIVANLLENAIKYTKKGFIEFGYKKIKNQIEIYVKDTGIGIQIENQENVFDKFSQEEKEISKKTGGLGLGLAIAKENTVLLGGSISIESEKGKGTTFLIKIPYNQIDVKKEMTIK